MADIGDTARTTVGLLMDMEAVLFRPDDPFVFTSGRASPVYVDCRKVISFPQARSTLMDLAVEMIEREIERIFDAFVPDNDPEYWDIESLLGELKAIMPLPAKFGTSTDIVYKPEVSTSD